MLCEWVQSPQAACQQGWICCTVRSILVLIGDSKLLQDLLTRHKPMVAGYLSRNYNQVGELTPADLTKFVVCFLCIMSPLM